MHYLECSTPGVSNVSSILGKGATDALLQQLNHSEVFRMKKSCKHNSFPKMKQCQWQNKLMNELYLHACMQVCCCSRPQTGQTSIEAFTLLCQFHLESHCYTHGRKFDSQTGINCNCESGYHTNNYKASTFPRAQGFRLVTPDPFLVEGLGLGMRR